jgi:hypothetical protein
VIVGQLIARPRPDWCLACADRHLILERPACWLAASRNEAFAALVRRGLFGTPSARCKKRGWDSPFASLLTGGAAGLEIRERGTEKLKGVLWLGFLAPKERLESSQHGMVLRLRIFHPDCS